MALKNWLVSVVQLARTNTQWHPLRNDRASRRQSRVFLRNSSVERRARRQSQVSTKARNLDSEAVIRQGTSRCKSNASDGLAHLPSLVSDAEDEKEDVDVDYEPPPRSADEDGCSSVESSQGESIAEESELEGLRADGDKDSAMTEAEDTAMASVDDYQPVESQKGEHTPASTDSDSKKKGPRGPKEEAFLAGDDGVPTQGGTSTHYGAGSSLPTSQQSPGEPGKAVRRSVRSKR
ncbi:hypothetical protein BCV69DRAFT_149971 [Microstroma glucosiphilum]|uniref:Uncharacterized protein n=1 Tax=Pseudomicrostroma glucosiphilum TaxID=1684307 RepID=A0A316UCH5_9BASI|nr:hypothetical protein BCV69DRAFT_149971 [Pseudomicrostroma glucosiphilum]PWN22568.1 hypothetical protein BCV69DRAFT_149971 [Pseudomicrostroma glucosiphilum]